MQPSPVQIMIESKQLDSVEYFSCLGSMMTNNARCARGIEYRSATEKAAFNKKKTFFTRKLELIL